MGNCFKIVKKLFIKSSRLSAIINKSRIFNTYEFMVEFLAIIFYNVIPKRTNQKSLVTLYST